MLNRLLTWLPAVVDNVRDSLMSSAPEGRGHRHTRLGEPGHHPHGPAPVDNLSGS